jgi:hypothetical protein
MQNGLENQVALAIVIYGMITKSLSTPSQTATMSFPCLQERRQNFQRISSNWYTSGMGERVDRSFFLAFI